MVAGQTRTTFSSLGGGVSGGFGGFGSLVSISQDYHPLQYV